jgi:hypothetical protein
VKRRLFNLAAAVSLVMMLAMVALWVRSYWVGDNLERYNTTRTYFGSALGRLGITVVHPRKWDTFTGDGTWHLRHPLLRQGFSLDVPAPPYARRAWRVLGFGYADVGFDPNPHFGSENSPYQQVVIPHWFVVLMTAVAPAWCGWRMFRSAWRKSRPGTCAVCGYDLRATPERCPECGTAVAQRARRRDRRRLRQVG